MSGRTRTVLLADPDPATLEVVRAALGPEGYEVVEAGDSARALARLRAGGVDALLCELALPDADGLHLLVEARLRSPLVPRIVLTARDDFAAVVSAVNEAEIFRYLQKPVAPATLRAAIVEALGRADTMHEVKGLQERAERRRLALVDLETDFPGISLVSHGPDGYFTPRQRMRGLAVRLQGTPLGPVLAAAFEAASEPRA